ncbi:LuxR C-terminal-related transcriptional regulator [Streptomyces omiyaensis]|uniref:LuxR C-terminal-related transcriptional regulator n=1 Tax=Streptomyces omiyaensis TaxID=68247 RepID=A0ABW7BKX2_9ACTN
MIDVLVVSDESLLRLASRALTADDPEVTVIGEAVDAGQAMRMSSTLRPDVILLDSRLSKGKNLRTIAGLTRQAPTPFEPGTSRGCVLVMNLTERGPYALEALRAGARGLVFASEPAPHLLAAIKTVAAGGAVLPPQYTHLLMETVREHQNRPLPPAKDGWGELTARERQVLAGVASGWSNADIAARLNVSLPTVKSHVTRIFRKIGIRTRVEAVSLAYESGLLARSR